MDEVKQEYLRIAELFKDVDEKQLALVEGAILEAARLRVQLNHLNEIVEKTGLLKIHPENPTIQKELPVSKLLPKIRANYTNIIFKLSKVLGLNFDEDDLGLDEYV